MKHASISLSHFSFRNVSVDISHTDIGLRIILIDILQSFPHIVVMTSSSIDRQRKLYRRRSIHHFLRHNIAQPLKAGNSTPREWDISKLSRKSTWTKACFEHRRSSISQISLWGYNLFQSSPTFCSKAHTGSVSTVSNVSSGSGGSRVKQCTQFFRRYYLHQMVFFLAYCCTCFSHKRDHPDGQLTMLFHALFFLP